MSRIINLGEVDNRTRVNIEKDSTSLLVLKSIPKNSTENRTIEFPKKKRSKWKLISILFLIVLLLCGLIVYTLFGFNFQSFSDKLNLFNSSTCTGKICTEYNDVKIDNTVCVGIFCANNKFNLPKTNNRTNILVMGIDTRENGSSTFLTDTIIVISYDHSSGYVYMISLPRDLAITYENYYGQQVTTKINELYYNGGQIEDHHEEGVLTLQKEVETITGLTIHYNAMITLKGFVDLIDKLGGIDVTLKEDTSDVYPLSELSPTYAKSKCISTVFVEDGNYCEWLIKAGNNHLDGQTALMYARSRKYSSDWVRAGRQQEVINAIRSKVSSSSTLSNPQKLLDIISTLKDSIKTSKYSINDLLAALDLKNNFKKIVQIVLDPNFGNGQLIGSGPKGTYLGSHQVIFDDTFIGVQSYLNLIYKNPDIYIDKPNIYVYSDIDLNKLKLNYYDEFSNEDMYPGAIVNFILLQDCFETFGISKASATQTISVSKSSTQSNAKPVQVKYKVYLIDYSKGTKTLSESKIKSLFPEIEIITTNSNKTALNGEDFAIVIAGE